MSTTLPTETPNVHIENPKIRKILRTILDTIGVVTVVTQGVDLASPDFDIFWLTAPILAGYGIARAAFGFGVDNPNTPTLR